MGILFELLLWPHHIQAFSLFLPFSLSIFLSLKMEWRRRDPQPNLLCALSHFLLICLPFWAIAQRGEGENGRRRLQLDVGVVLEMDSWIGNMSWSYMKMAVDDFYALHPAYSTRISLHLRDSGNDAFGAAAAAIDLLKNVQVKAIIGPQQSPQAKFVMEIGDKAHVPIISFSAKSPSLSSTQNPYFIRTAYNDSTQAKVIASIVQEFKWRQVVPIYIDDEYGNGILPYLINAFQEIDVSVPYRSSIPPSATKDQIREELKNLKQMQTRVFIAHMTCDLGLQVFTIAEEEGMLKEGYVWITTYGLTDIVNLMGSSATDVMQGIVGVKPFVNMTNKLRDFTQRWRKTFHQRNPPAHTTEPLIFGLWAYDTVWSLALAVEKVKMANFTFQVPDIHNGSTDIASIGISSGGPELLQSIQRTEFDGMAGKFRLIGGQLKQHAFEIVNVVGQVNKRIGLWTPPNNLSGRRNSTDKLDTIIWPGGAELLPRGWEWPIAGKKLRIGVPVKTGYPQIIHIEGDPHSKNQTPKGYCIDVFETVMKDLPYAPYKYFLYGDSEGRSNGTYDDLIYQVYLKNFDAVVGDVSIIANRSLYVDFTLPYTESGVSMLVPIKDKREKGAWTFLKPLTTDLWLGSGAFFIFTGFVIWFLEHKINAEFRGEPAKQIGTIFYFSFSTLVFAHREKVLSNLSRLVVIVWLFVVLILQSSYTASLTSMLTVEQLQPTVTDLNDLIKNGNSVGYLNNSFMPSFLKRLHFNESKLIPYLSPEEYHDALKNGTVSAIVDEIPYLRIFLNKYCGKYTMIGPTYKNDGFGFVFPKNSPLVPEVSRAILKLLESDKMIDIENTLYNNMRCPIQQEDDTSSSSLSFRSFWGLFLITGVASLAALVLYLAYFLYKHQEVLQTIDPESSIWRKLIFLAQLYYYQLDSTKANNTAKAAEESAVDDGTMVPGDAMTTPAISGPQTPSSISIHALDTFESEEEIEASSSGEEDISGREMSRHNPEPPSFADMLTPRDQDGS